MKFITHNYNGCLVFRKPIINMPSTFVLYFVCTCIPNCSIHVFCFQSNYYSNKWTFSLLCCLWSIAAHRDHFVRHMSVHLCVCLSGSHTFLVVMHSFVTHATHAFLGMLPQFLILYHIMPSVAKWCIYLNQPFWYENEFEWYMMQIKTIQNCSWL